MLMVGNLTGHDAPVPPTFQLRNGQHGYGALTKALHWLTVVLITAQFVVGWTMEDDSGGGRGRGRGRGEGSGHGRGRGGDGSDFDGIDQLPLHVGLGIAILVVAIVRVAWRLSTPLPPWDERLSPMQRRLLGGSERVLLLMLFAIPLTGLGMVLSEEDDYLGLHVTSHVLFFAALAVHVGVVVAKRLLPRMI